VPDGYVGELTPLLSPHLDFITKALGPLPSSSYFTRRESQILMLILSGQTKKETAHQLGISPKTVSMFLTTARARVGARTSEQLIGFVAAHPFLLNEKEICIETIPPLMQESTRTSQK